MMTSKDESCESNPDAACCSWSERSSEARFLPSAFALPAVSMASRARRSQGKKFFRAGFCETSLAVVRIILLGSPLGSGSLVARRFRPLFWPVLMQLDGQSENLLTAIVVNGLERGLLK